MTNKKRKTLKDSLNKLSAEDRNVVEARAQELLEEEMALQEIRKACQFSQATLAEVLEVQQCEISKMERRVDMYISTLRRYIEAMGGSLEILASFPNCGTVRIKHLSSPCFR